MSLPTAAEITRLYLYGQTTFSTPNLTSDERIRPIANPANVVMAPAVDVNDYMDGGPGRFVNAAAFEVIHKFFSAAQGIPPSPSGGYTKGQLFTLFGMDGLSQLKRRAAFVSQSDFTDNKNDLLERAYIWQTTGFQIDNNARFFVAANGTRTVTNFGIVPYSAESSDGITPANVENFDFTGGGTVSNLAGALLKPMIDPSDIGRVVNIPFTGVRTLTPVFTSADFNAAVSSLPLPSRVENLKTINAGANQFVQGLFDSGVIKFLDSQNRPILYGTDKSDPIAGSTSVTGIDISKSTLVNGALGINQPLSAYVRNGIAYIAGKGNDNITSSTTNDYLDGGTGDDNLKGGFGTDNYVFKAGDGKDTILDTDGNGQITVAGNVLSGAAFADYKLLPGGQGQWSVNNGATVYTLDASHKQLVITGSSLGADSKITVN
ncbi:MAG: hypothetical protein Q7T21_09275, partial [Gallionella sp.]|nr:hypothetical protein [Gallionella sp.]